MLSQRRSVAGSQFRREEPDIASVRAQRRYEGRSPVKGRFEWRHRFLSTGLTQASVQESGRNSARQSGGGRGGHRISPRRWSYKTSTKPREDQ
jgi:hypothetical protein